MLSVDLIFTNDFGYLNTIKVCEYLKQFAGPIEFNVQTNKPIDNRAPVDLSRTYDWGQISEIISRYRTQYVKRSRRLVVLLSGLNYEYHWLSKHHGDDIYIHTTEWEKYVGDGINPLLPICHQVVENVLQVLMEIKTQNDELVFYHRDGGPCLNFYAKEKQTFLAKIKAADICPICKEQIDKKIDKSSFNQIDQLIEQIRSDLRWLKDSRKPTDLKVLVDKNVDIIMGGQRVNFKPLEKSIYALFLHHPEGIILNEIEKEVYKRFLRKLYQSASISYSLEEFEPLFESLITKTFTKHRSEINAKIFKIGWDESVIQSLLIKGERGKPYLVGIDRSKVTFNPDLMKRLI